jgi:hypothetical protein
MRTLKERINIEQEKIINKFGKNNISLSDRKKIKNISNNVFKYVFFFLEGLIMGYFYLFLIPAKKGWGFAITAVLLSILFVLTIMLLNQKRKIYKNQQ